MFNVVGINRYLNQNSGQDNRVTVSFPLPQIKFTQRDRLGLRTAQEIQDRGLRCTSQRPGHQKTICLVTHVPNAPRRQRTSSLKQRSHDSISDDPTPP